MVEISPEIKEIINRYIHVLEKSDIHLISKPIALSIAFQNGKFSDDAPFVQHFK